MIIAEKMFPEYGRDELFLSQTERIALNACFEAVRIEVAGKVKLNRSGSARSKVGRSVRREISIAVMAVEGSYG